MSSDGPMKRMQTTTNNEGRAGQKLKAETRKAESAAGESAAARVERLLTKQEVADRLQVDLRTVERWMAMGVLKPLRVLGVVRFIWVEVVVQLKERSEARGARCEAEGKQKVENRNLKTGIGAEGNARGGGR